MTINNSNIKLLASQVMDDVPEGGGAPTAIEIIDGSSNSIFSDISPLDRAGGNVSLRKVFTHVQTADTDTYSGSTAILMAPPLDPRVSVLMFSTNDTFDRRTAAQDRVEAYLFGSAVWAGFLYENHIEGQRVVQLFQRENTELPPVGKTLVLVQNEGLTNEKKQYVRTTRVSATVRTFSRAGSTSGETYKALIVSCEISDTLRFDFTGSPASETFERATNATLVRDTNVADAAKYYGVAPLTAPLTLGTLTAAVSSIYSSLVPAAQTEIPIVDTKPNGAAPILAPAGAAMVISRTQAFDITHAIALGQPFLAGTLSITAGASTIVDVGGKLFIGTLEVGTCDYSQGILKITSGSYPGTKSITYTPASLSVRDLQTASWSVTAESRSGTIVGILSPLPAAGSATVSFRAQGKWYSLFDDGAGRLKGADVAFGSGTINYETGSLIVTMGALPDVGSKILMTYGLYTTETQRSGTVVAPKFRIQLGNTNIAPSSVTLTWNDGTARTVTDNGTGGFTGYGTGTINYVLGEVIITPTTMPASTVDISAEYSYGDPIVQTFTNPGRDGAGKLNLTLTNPNVMPNSMQIEWNTVYDATEIGNYRSDLSPLINGLVPVLPEPHRIEGGNPIITLQDNGTGGFTQHTETVPVINYTAGTLQFKPDVSMSLPGTAWTQNEVGRTPIYTQQADGSSTVTPGSEISPSRTVLAGYTYIPIPATYPSGTGSYVKVTYRTTAAGTTVTGEMHDMNFTADLVPTTTEPIVPGSVSFTQGASFYVERQGVIYKDPDPVTGTGTVAGALDYTTGLISLTTWAPGAQPSITVTSLVTTIGTQPTDTITFRTAVAPLRPSSLVVQYVLATPTGQVTASATADSSGVITGSHCFGVVDYETGVVEMIFGQRVTAAGNESKYWYNPDMVDTGTGTIWRPDQVFADTVRYAAVAYSYLPLDADILGVDPVRLPQDGRVPIYRPGGFVVVGNDHARAPGTVSDGLTIDLGRERLARVKVIGDDGVTITTGYTHNLDAGTITFTDTGDYDQPVTIIDRIEDLVMVSDVQINGQLAFTSPLTHDFPEESYISSALVLGNLHARVPLLFDQGTWTNVFSDVIIGDPASGTYNDVLSPVIVTNTGALTERWAIRFTNTNAFELIGEHVGIIATGNTSTDLAPNNPATGTPYFRVNAIGWGSGWVAGNVLRFNTVGAMAPIWMVRTVQQGPATVDDDFVTVLINGGIDRP